MLAMIIPQCRGLRQSNPTFPFAIPLVVPPKEFGMWKEGFPLEETRCTQEHIFTLKTPKGAGGRTEK